MHCSNSPTVHNEVKDLYIAAVKASPQDVDADVQVAASVCQYYYKTHFCVHEIGANFKRQEFSLPMKRLVCTSTSRTLGKSKISTLQNCEIVVFYSIIFPTFHSSLQLI